MCHILSFIQYYGFISSCHSLPFFQKKNSQLALLQGRLSQLIYRYLAGGGQGEEHQKTGEDAEQRRRLLEEADRKTRLLLSLVQDIQTAADIMRNRTRSRLQDTNAFSCSSSDQFSV